MSLSTTTSLFESYDLAGLHLMNRIVMSPMTRCRATPDHTPTALQATYYGQRADAGLIVTEGTAPSPNGAGYARIPGIYSSEQVEAWKPVTKAVHEKGGKIFVQLMHSGRISHPLNMPEGSRILAPSAVKAAGQMWTDQQQMQDFPVPEEMSAEDIQVGVAEFGKAASNAMEAGFDGVELHGANGYLLEQFLNPNVNRRTDAYGGSIMHRAAFALEAVDAVIAAIGAEKTGIRLSPYGAASDMQPYDEVDETYAYLADALNERKIAYIHVVDHSSMGAPEVPQRVKDAIRSRFKGAFILAGGLSKETAEQAIAEGRADLVAFARPFISNPDLISRFKNDQPLSEWNMATFYSAGPEGYTDYPLA
ncbi:MAG TPA: alkene reductase [Fimbriimonadaceae bacterium]|nr:alkene reductase [Fimbriimonadaceae bacterium]